MGEHLQVQQVKPRSGRLVVFDLLKLLAIFLVLWGHCVQHLLSPAYGEEPLHRVIYSFHMPLFMMISGFFAGSSARLTWGVFLKKKFVQLLLPWLTWSALLIVAKALATSTLWGLGLSDHGIDEERLLSYIDVFEGSFWFLKTAFVCHVLSFIAMQAGRYKALAIAISLLASHYLNFVQLPSIMYASFLVGMLLKARWEQFVRHARVIFPIALVGYLLLFLWSEQYMPLTIHLFSNPWAWALKIPLGLLGSIAVVALFAIIFSDDQTEVLSPPPPYMQFAHTQYSRGMGPIHTRDLYPPGLHLGDSDAKADQSRRYAAVRILLCRDALDLGGYACGVCIYREGHNALSYPSLDVSRQTISHGY